MVTDDPLHGSHGVVLDGRGKIIIPDPDDEQKGDHRNEDHPA
jgi:hypothetical protein